MAQGDVLAVMDQREARVALREAELSLSEARNSAAAMQLAREEANERHERAKLTYEQSVRDFERNEKAGLISQSDLDQMRLTRDQSYRDLQAARVAVDAAIQNEKSAETTIEKAQVAVERQQLALGFTEVTAPFDGVIARRSVRIGDSVSSAASAFVLTDPDSLRAIFARPQRDLPLFRRATLAVADGEATEGRSAIEIRAHTEAVPGVVFDGRIQLVSPTIDATSGSFRVTVGLEGASDEDTGSSSARLLPGMLVRLDIVTDRHPDALVIPKRAMQREGETNFTYVVRDGLARRIEVREGFSDDQYVEIFTVDEPIAEGEAVVAVGNRDLEDGDQVDTEAWNEGEEASASDDEAMADKAILKEDGEDSSSTATAADSEGTETDQTESQDADSQSAQTEADGS